MTIVLNVQVLADIQLWRSVDIGIGIIADVFHNQGFLGSDQGMKKAVGKKQTPFFQIDKKNSDIDFIENGLEIGLILVDKRFQIGWDQFGIALFVRVLLHSHTISELNSFNNLTPIGSNRPGQIDPIWQY